ncbi:MAG TPA: MBL fold metallo-hydrolase, partial [Thermoanaerobaculia bacterium]|nr:MBL fold metallo-hydrolase [Thermoanaerobaculia bacterium]
MSDVLAGSPVAQRSLFDLWSRVAPIIARPRPVASAPPLRVVVLGSGSGGNAVVVESGGRRLLIDAGFSSRELARRLTLVGVEPGSLSALVLTHE